MRILSELENSLSEKFAVNNSLDTEDCEKRFMANDLINAYFQGVKDCFHAGPHEENEELEGIIYELKTKLALAVEALEDFSYYHFDGSKNGHACGVGCDMGGAGHPTDELGHDIDCLFKKATEALKAINGGE